MLRLERLIFAAVIAGLVAAGTSTAVRADEAYVCEDGKVVYVKLTELEEKKRTNKCVAAYWGLTVEDGKQDTKKEAVEHTDALPPVKSFAPPALKPTAKPETETQRGKVEEKAAEIVTPPKPAPNTDYRNVKVINGGDGGSWFRHTR